MNRRARVISVGVAGIGLVVLLWCFLNVLSPASDGIQMQFVGRVADRMSNNVSNAPFVPDDLFLKFHPRTRQVFHVTAVRDCSILVWASGVEVTTSSGPKGVNEEYRGNIFRLTNGVPYEICVDPPESGEWKAYLRYAPEIRGLERLKVQFRVAWRTGSFSNWTGKAWGGGFFAGSNYLVSQSIQLE